MGDSRQDDVLEVFEDGVHVFSLCGSMFWEFGFDFSRLDVWLHGIFFDVVHEVGDPVNYFVSVFSKLFRVHLFVPLALTG